MFYESLFNCWANKQLGKYSNQLQEFEKTYNPPMKQVPQEEWKKDFCAHFEKNIEEALLYVSKNFAQAILAQLNND